MIFPEYRHGKVPESQTKKVRPVIPEVPTIEGNDTLPNMGMNLTEYIENLENKLILQALEEPK